MADSSDLPLLVVFAGNIATGKTTLAQVVAAQLGLDVVEESVDDNPYLERFYEDMPSWIFHLNMYFLGSRAESLRAAASSRGAVLDRSFYEDLVFVDLARADGVSPPENYAVFRSLYDPLAALLPTPTVLVYLETTPEVLYERVRQRGRPYEAGLTVEYLSRVQAFYDEWIASYARSPVVRIDVGSVDLRQDQDAVGRLTSEIQTLAQSG